ncbi:MFS transporter [Camelimonas abortus]|uniref:MFS transporter n=1 Tax=Camelimonas abortus TaxID=1017184 RepID=A0ABV7LDX8_9HYPH
MTVPASSGPDASDAAASEAPAATRVGRPIFFLALASFVSAATARVADPLLPDIGRDFGVSPGDAGLVVAAFSVSYGLLQAIYGPVGDIFGKYRMVAVATFLSSFGVAASALAGSLTSLAAARFLSGATAAAIIPLSMAWIGDVVPYDQRQSVLARFMTGQILGLVFGQAAGGALSEFMSWREVFFTLGGLYLLAAAGLVSDLLRKDHPAGQRAPGASVLKGVGAMLSLLGRWWPRTVVVMVFLEGAIVFGSWAYVGAELQRRFGVGAAVAGGVLGVFGFGGLAYAMNAGRLVKRFGERGLVLGGGAGLALAFLAVAFTPALAGAVIASVLCGFSFYMLHNTLQTNATQMAPEARGAAVSLFASSLFIGQTVGVAIVGPAFDRWGGQPGLVVAAALTPLLTLWFVARQRRRRA